MKDSVKEKEKENTTLMIAIIIALVCAIVFGACRNTIEKININAWLLAKRSTAISCSPGTAPLSNNADHNLPGDTNKGNCSHQGAAGFLCSRDDKKSKVHDC